MDDNGKSCSWVDIGYCITQFCKRFCSQCNYCGPLDHCTQASECGLCETVEFYVKTIIFDSIIYYGYGRYFPRWGSLFQLNIYPQDFKNELVNFKNGYMLHSNGKWGRANKLSGYWCDDNVTQFYVVEYDTTDQPISIYWGEYGWAKNFMIQWKVGEIWIESSFIIDAVMDITLIGQMIINKPNILDPIPDKDKADILNSSTNIIFF